VNCELIDTLHAVTSPLSLVLLRGQLRYLQTAGFHPAALSGPGAFAEQMGANDCVPVFTVAMEREVSSLRDLASLIRIWRLLRRLRPSICNAGTPKAALLVMLAAWMARVPCRIYTMRGLRLETASGLQRMILVAAERIACACAHRVICVSPSLRDRAVNMNLVATRKTVVLGSGSSNGVDVDRFVPQPPRIARATEIRRELKLGNGPVIGYIGRFTRDKGIGELTAAFDLVRAHFQALLGIISSEKGAVVKTIGDAVMATFVRPEHAIVAGLRMRAAMDELNAQRGRDDLVVKIGIHEGPCLAVMLNERQDYFGQTVNIAARVQGLSTSQAIHVTGPVIDTPAVAAILEKQAITPIQKKAALRGIADTVVVYEIP